MIRKHFRRRFRISCISLIILQPAPIVTLISSQFSRKNSPGFSARSVQALRIGWHSVTVYPRWTPPTSIVCTERIFGQPSFVLELFLPRFGELVCEFCITQHAEMCCCAMWRS